MYQYPYGNAQQLNLDWVLSKLQELEAGSGGAADIEEIANTLVSASFDAGVSYRRYDYCFYNGKLYRALNDTTGAFNPADWLEVVIGDDIPVLTRLLNAVDTSLTTLQGQVDDLDSDDVDNASTVVSGDTVTDALETLNTAITNLQNAVDDLDSDDVDNASTVVSGDTVTDALETLNTAINDLTSYTHDVSSAKLATLDTTNIANGSITSIKSGNMVQISGQIQAVAAGVGAWLQTLCTLSADAKANNARTVWAYANYDNNWEMVALELLANGTLRTRISSGAGHQIIGNSWITIPNQLVFE